ncbi:hypothetical protein KY284_010633 [Solanum tuberosum]|nr:hypothetical protein KY284_010633 [Solanum tuberosum]
MDDQKSKRVCAPLDQRVLQSVQTISALMDDQKASPMNFTAHTEITKKGKKAFATTWPPLAEVVFRGEAVDISETTLKKFLHGPEYTTPSIVGLLRVGTMQ